MVLAANGVGTDLQMEGEGPIRHGDVVITTTADTPPAACRQFADLGARVVILTSAKTCAEGAKYALAGAAEYLEMTADASALVGAVRAATATPPILLDAG